ncbi:MULTISPECIES: sugar transferase [Spirosoma]|uniref:Sugar transferase n=1 Tax=Spirosoma liriopis TaxID=2937440 RepID=A0ABT0HKW1_9BACT|nr:MULTISPECIES: sugar transferase [Spirosoma]MCK8492783.1 sugar transferase [Spirosoma liriopis]UHG92247.1 sugar transferase [Spirosoma oryzicola]
MLGFSLPSLDDSAVLNESFSATVSHQVKLSRGHRWGKRLFDVVVSGLVIVTLLIWIVPLIGLFIRLTSPGPMLFRQVRTGRNGRPFRCLKFRTMRFDKQAEFRQATKNDSRITPIGRFLRKTNLDELPQVFNVLLGDMSIVGPRPHPVQLDAQHWYTLPSYASRYAVKPGITGLAQVRGCRGETANLIDMEHRVRFDRFYISKQSPWLDLSICWWTAFKMLTGDKKAW